MNKIQYEDQLVADLFDAQPQPVLWMKPLWNDSNEKIIDFEYVYCNNEMSAFAALSKEQIVGERLSTTPLLNDEWKEKALEQSIAVYETGNKLQDTIYNAKFDKHYNFLRSKVQDGVLTVLQDRSQEFELIKKLEEQTKQLEAQTAFSESVLNASLHGIFVLEAIRDNTGAITDLKIVKINKRYTTITGLDEKYWENRSVLATFPAIKEHRIFDIFCSVIKTGEPAIKEQHYIGRGNDKWYQYSVVRMGTDNAVVTFKDITDEKKSDETIERQKNLLENILRCSPNGITVSKAVRDKDGHVHDYITIVANDAAAEIVGISKADLLSKSAKELSAGILNSTIGKGGLDTLSSGKSFTTQFFHEKTNKWLEFSVARMDEDHLINVFIDVTNTKKGQLQLENSIEALKRSNANLEEFAYAASHDLKEPIRKMRTFGDRLKTKLSNRLDEEEARMFERLEKSSERMELLVDDLLTYSHVSESPRQFETINMNEKLRRVMEDLEMTIEEKGAKITVDVLPTIHAHRRQIQQLFQNLISNSLKYSKPSVTPEIHISCKEVAGAEIGEQAIEEDRNKKFFLFTVTDNGIGFEQQYAERIFQMFQRLHGKHEYSGTGVGLSIARKVVENHQGYILAESEPEKGATFKVFLPVQN
jgi:signal transduction histidine kinase